jgi:hypothetical protein
MKPAQVLIYAALLCSAIGTPAAVQRLLLAEVWLARVPALPATSEAAYAQWNDASGGLRPGPEFEKVRDGIQSEVLSLSRPPQATTGTQGGALSKHDQALASKITVFPDTTRTLQNIQAARAAQATLMQDWQAELHRLEQRRVLERGALPACHNETGAPSQIAIREIELAYVQQRITTAAHYLEQFRPLVQRMLAAVSARIAHGDKTMQAWQDLRDPAAQAQFAPVARAAESDALLDVGLVQDFIQDISKVAARPIAERKALGRVYADAKGC